MKVAINPCTWGGYATFKGVPFDWQQFVRDAAQAGYAGVEFGGTPLPAKAAGEDALQFVRTFHSKITVKTILEERHVHRTGQGRWQRVLF